MITIGGRQLAIPEGCKIRLLKSVADDVEGAGVGGFRTTTIKVPLTPENAAILGHPQDVKSIQLTDLVAVIHSPACDITGVVVIVQSDSTTCEIAIYGQELTWLKKLKETPLTQLDTSEIDHELTVSNVQASEGGALPYVYDVCYRGEPQKEGELQLQERLPAVKIVKLMELICLNAGVRFASDTLYMPEFQNIVLLCTQSDNLLGSEFKPARFEVLRASEVRTYRFLCGTPQVIGFFSGLPAGNLEFLEVKRNDENYFVPSTPEKFIVPEKLNGAAVKFRARARFKLTREADTTIFCEDLGAPSSALVDIYITRNGSTMASTRRGIMNSQWGVEFDIEVATHSHRVATGDVYMVYFAVEGYVLGTDGYKTNIYLHCLPLSDGSKWIFEDFVSPYYATGEMVQVSKMLPDVSQAEFLRMVGTALDLVFYYDEASGTLRAENRAYFNDNWKVEMPMDVILSDDAVGRNTSVGSVEFRFANDTSDKGYITLKKSPREVVPSYAYTYSAGIEQFEVPFADTAMVDGKRIGLAGVQVPALLSEPEKYTNGQLILPEYHTKFTPRLCRYEGTRVAAYKYDNAPMYVMPVLTPLSLQEFVNFHGQRLNETFGKRINVKGVLSASYVNKLIYSTVPLSIRTPVEYAGVLWRVVSVDVDVATLDAEIELVQVSLRMVSDSGGQFSTPQMYVGDGTQNIEVSYMNELIFNGETDFQEDLT